VLPSSFGTQIVLGKKVSAGEYLDHNITDFYVLADAPDELVRAVGRDIYTFSYCYASGCEGFPAFVLAADGGNSTPHQTQMQVLFQAVAVLLQGFRTVRVFSVTCNAFLQHQVVFFTQLGHGGGSIMKNLHHIG